MKFKDLINERFNTAFHHHGNYFEVYENPTKGEIKNLIDDTVMDGSLRIGVEDKKNPTVYVWDAECTHRDIKSKTNIVFDIGFVYRPHDSEIIKTYSLLSDDWYRKVKNKKEIIKSISFQTENLEPMII